MSTLSALIEATGFSLEVAVGVALATTAPTAPGPIGRRVGRRRAAVRVLAEKHGMRDLRVFGSVTRGEDGSDSDLDLMVRPPEGSGLFTISRFAEDHEDLLQVRVDGVPEGTLMPRVGSRVESDLVEWGVAAATRTGCSCPKPIWPASAAGAGTACRRMRAINSGRD